MVKTNFKTKSILDTSFRNIKELRAMVKIASKKRGAFSQLKI